MGSKLIWFVGSWAAIMGTIGFGYALSNKGKADNDAQTNSAVVNQRIKQFLTSGRLNPRHQVITNHQMRNFSFADFTDKDYQLMAKQLSFTIPHMPMEFFKKFSSNTSSNVEVCDEKFKLTHCFQIWRVNLDGNKQSGGGNEDAKPPTQHLFLPLSADDYNQNIKIKIQDENNKPTKLKIDFAGTEGSEITISQLEQQNFAANDQYKSAIPKGDVNSVQKIQHLWKIYKKVIQRLKQFKNPQESNNMDQLKIEFEVQ